MDITNNYDIITYKRGDTDKYTNQSISGDCTIYYMNRQRHRENDQPAIIYANGRQEWYVNGQLHRENDQPAIIVENGAQVWYINGKRHRNNDQPASIWNNGRRVWYINGKVIRGRR